VSTSFIELPHHGRRANSEFEENARDQIFAASSDTSNGEGLEMEGKTKTRLIRMKGRRKRGVEGRGEGEGGRRKRRERERGEERGGGKVVVEVERGGRWRDLDGLGVLGDVEFRDDDSTIEIYMRR